AEASDRQDLHPVRSTMRWPPMSDQRREKSRARRVRRWRAGCGRMEGAVMSSSTFKCYLGKQFEDAYLLGLGGPMQDADELDNLVSSKGRGLYYKNERVDALFDLGRGTMDMAKRRHVYRDLARAMVEDATWVFLLQQVDIYA